MCDCAGYFALRVHLHLGLNVLDAEQVPELVLLVLLLLVVAAVVLAVVLELSLSFVFVVSFLVVRLLRVVVVVVRLFETGGLVVDSSSFYFLVQFVVPR